MPDSPAKGFPAELSLADAEAIKAGLVHSIETSDDPDIPELADEIRDTAPWIDGSGTLYIGSWRLDRSKERIIKRPLGGREGPVFECDVELRDGE